MLTIMPPGTPIRRAAAAATVLVAVGCALPERSPEFFPSLESPALIGSSAAAGARPGSVRAAAPEGRVPDPARGGLLYEHRCAGCHDRSVHSREPKTARSCQ